MLRDSWVFYRSFYEAGKDLPEENRATFFDMLLTYMFDGIVIESDDSIAKAMFKLCKPQVDANNKRYVNGKSGGKKKLAEPKRNQNVTKTEPKANQNVTKTEPNVNVNVNVNENDNVNVNENENVNKVLFKNNTTYGDPSINEVLEKIKSKCKSYSIVYNSDYERIFGKHILSNKFKEIAQNYNFDNWLDFALFVLDASMQDWNWWKWKVDWPKSIYQKYPRVLNDLKPKRVINEY